MGFFPSCQRQCEEGRTIVVLARLQGLCNTHTSMVMETVRDRMLTTLEVTKVSNSEPRSENRLSFQVEPDLGVKIVPMSRVRA